MYVQCTHALTHKYIYINMCVYILYIYCTLQVCEHQIEAIVLIPADHTLLSFVFPVGC